MRPIAPTHGIPGTDDVKVHIVGEDQEEYKPIPMIRIHFPDAAPPFQNQTMVRYTLSDQERARIAAGEDLALMFPRPYLYAHSLQLLGDVYHDARKEV